jgi:predicted Zn-dependent peptidase
MNEYKIITLKHGFRLILVPKASTEVMTTIVMFGVGSRYESEKLAGISHVLEHMHFKGTSKRPTALDISKFVDSFGGEANAFTGKEVTGYYVKARPKNMEKVMDFLSDMLLHSKIDSTELEKEKNVIIQEINMYEDLPMEMVGSKFDEAVFGKNSLGRDIIGYKKSVAAVKAEEIIEYKGNFYHGSNGVIVLAGNFGGKNDKELANLVEEYFQFPDKTSLPLEKIEINNSKTKKITIKKTEQSHLIVGFRTVSLNHPDFFKLELLATILGGSMSSRMFEEIREKRGLAYAVRTSTSSYVESGSLETQAGIPHEKVYETVEAIIGEYKKIKNKLVPEEELAKAKEITLGRMLIKFEDSEELAYHFAQEALLAQKIYSTGDLIAAYQKIGSNDILEAAKKYLVDDRMSLAFIGPKLDELKLEKIFKI